MPRGQVKWFDPKKGYGFIIGPEGQDVFVHYSHIQADGFKSLKDGQWVDYELVEGEKGWQARTVAGAEAAAGDGDGAAGPVSGGYEAPPDMDQPSPSSGAAAPPRSGGYESGGGYEGGSAGGRAGGGGYSRGGYEGADD